MVTTTPGMHPWQAVDRPSAIKCPIPVRFRDGCQARWPVWDVDARSAPAFGCAEEQAS